MSRLPRDFAKNLECLSSVPREVRESIESSGADLFTRAVMEKVAEGHRDFAATAKATEDALEKFSRSNPYAHFEPKGTPSELVQFYHGVITKGLAATAPGKPGFSISPTGILFASAIRALRDLTAAYAMMGVALEKLDLSVEALNAILGGSPSHAQSARLRQGLNRKKGRMDAAQLRDFIVSKIIKLRGVVSPDIEQEEEEDAPSISIEEEEEEEDDEGEDANPTQGLFGEGDLEDEVIMILSVTVLVVCFLASFLRDVRLINRLNIVTQGIIFMSNLTIGYATRQDAPSSALEIIESVNAKKEEKTLVSRGAEYFGRIGSLVFGGKKRDERREERRPSQRLRNVDRALKWSGRTISTTGSNLAALAKQLNLGGICSLIQDISGTMVLMTALLSIIVSDARAEADEDLQSLMNMALIVGTLEQFMGSTPEIDALIASLPPFLPMVGVAWGVVKTAVCIVSGVYHMALKFTKNVELQGLIVGKMCYFISTYTNGLFPGFKFPGHLYQTSREDILGFEQELEGPMQKAAKMVRDFVEKHTGFSFWDSKKFYVGPILRAPMIMALDSTRNLAGAGIHAVLPSVLNMDLLLTVGLLALDGELNGGITDFFMESGLGRTSLMFLNVKLLVRTASQSLGFYLPWARYRSSRELYMDVFWNQLQGLGVAPGGNFRIIPTLSANALREGRGFPGRVVVAALSATLVSFDTLATHLSSALLFTAAAMHVKALPNLVLEKGTLAAVSYSLQSVISMKERELVLSGLALSVVMGLRSPEARKHLDPVTRFFVAGMGYLRGFSGARENAEKAASTLSGILSHVVPERVASLKLIETISTRILADPSIASLVDSAGNKMSVLASWITDSVADKRSAHSVNVVFKAMTVAALEAFSLLERKNPSPGDRRLLGIPLPTGMLDKDLGEKIATVFPDLRETVTSFRHGRSSRIELTRGRRSAPKAGVHKGWRHLPLNDDPEKVAAIPREAIKSLRDAYRGKDGADLSSMDDHSTVELHIKFYSEFDRKFHLARRGFFTTPKDGLGDLQEHFKKVLDLALEWLTASKYRKEFGILANYIDHFETRINHEHIAEHGESVTYLARPHTNTTSSISIQASVSSKITELNRLMEEKLVFVFLCKKSEALKIK